MRPNTPVELVLRSKDLPLRALTSLMTVSRILPAWFRITCRPIPAGSVLSSWKGPYSTPRMGVVGSEPVTAVPPRLRKWFGPIAAVGTVMLNAPAESVVATAGAAQLSWPWTATPCLKLNSAAAGPQPTTRPLTFTVDAGQVPPLLVSLVDRSGQPPSPQL